jgi:hypothetical protein
MRPKAIVVLVLVALVSSGACAPTVRSWTYPTRIWRSPLAEPWEGFAPPPLDWTDPAAHPRRAPTRERPSRARALRPSPHSDPAAALVERALHARGLRFGTDGTVGALYGYLRETAYRVPPDCAQAGDVVFFDVGDGAGCGGHVGLVDAVDPDGRITFREDRAGLFHQSYVHAGQPSSRRDGQGRILNTFLRPKRPEDPPTTRYHAGEMLCAVLRI